MERNKIYFVRCQIGLQSEQKYCTNLQKCSSKPSHLSLHFKQAAPAPNSWPRAICKTTSYKKKRLLNGWVLNIDITSHSAMPVKSVSVVTCVWSRASVTVPGPWPLSQNTCAWVEARYCLKYVSTSCDSVDCVKIHSRHLAASNFIFGRSCQQIWFQWTDVFTLGYLNSGFIRCCCSYKIILLMEHFDSLETITSFNELIFSHKKTSE